MVLEHRLLTVVASRVAEHGSRAQASHSGGFLCCRAWFQSIGFSLWWLLVLQSMVLERRLSSLGLVASQRVESSQNLVWTLVPCIGGQTGHQGSPIHYFFKHPISTYCHTWRYSELRLQHMNTGGTWWLVLYPRLHCRHGGLIWEIPSHWLSNIYRQEKGWLSWKDTTLTGKMVGWAGNN